MACRKIESPPTLSSDKHVPFRGDPNRLITLQVGTLTGKNFSVDVFPTDTIHDIKKLIAHDHGVHPDAQALVFRGRPMRDAAMVYEYRLDTGNRLDLVLQLAGGHGPVAASLMRSESPVPNLPPLSLPLPLPPLPSPSRAQNGSHETAAVSDEIRRQRKKRRGGHHHHRGIPGSADTAHTNGGNDVDDDDENYGPSRRSQLSTPPDATSGASVLLLLCRQGDDLYLLELMLAHGSCTDVRAQYIGGPEMAADDVAAIVRAMGNVPSGNNGSRIGSSSSGGGMRFPANGAELLTDHPPATAAVRGGKAGDGSSTAASRSAAAADLGSPDLREFLQSLVDRASLAADLGPNTPSMTAASALSAQASGPLPVEWEHTTLRQAPQPTHRPHASPSSLPPLPIASPPPPPEDGIADCSCADPNNDSRGGDYDELTLHLYDPSDPIEYPSYPESRASSAASVRHRRRETGAKSPSISSFSSSNGRQARAVMPPPPTWNPCFSSSLSSPASSRPSSAESLVSIPDDIAREFGLGSAAQDHGSKGESKSRPSIAQWVLDAIESAAPHPVVASMSTPTKLATARGARPATAITLTRIGLKAATEAGMFLAAAVSATRRVQSAPAKCGNSSTRLRRAQQQQPSSSRPLVAGSPISPEGIRLPRLQQAPSPRSPASRSATPRPLSAAAVQHHQQHLLLPPLVPDSARRGLATPPPSKTAPRPRCCALAGCSKRLRGALIDLGALRCKCGAAFCTAHRGAAAHACAFDYRGAERERLIRECPVVVRGKVPGMD